MAERSTPPFGQLLRRYRLAAGLSQKTLAERAGLSVRGISDLESGRRHVPRLETVRMLAGALELDEAGLTTLLEARNTGAQSREASASGSPRAHGMPEMLDPLIGREREIADVSALLAHPEVRLLTLTGPGGTGKTRLGVAAAQSVLDAYPDGVAFVELAPVRGPSLVAATIAGVLRAPEVGGQELLDSVMAAIGERRILLVLDNFEHLIEAAPAVAELLQHCRHLQVLATSRTRLGLRGEQEYPVLPLAIPESDGLHSEQELERYPATRLFVQRARQVRPAFEVTAENGNAIALICRRLDGLPLAIELAAARSKVLSPRDLLARLEQPLAVLTTGPRDLPNRQQTMRATLQWSYDLLGPDEQVLFQRLAVFAGGFALDAAQHVAGEDAAIDILDVLEHLVDANLVMAGEQPDGTSRFSMLEVIREYGLEQLSASGDNESTRRRHAMHYLAWAERMGPEVLSREQAHAIQLLESEVDNVRAAFSWALVPSEPDQPLLDAALSAAEWLFFYWLARGRVGEGRHWLETALAKPGASDLARACGLNGAGALAAEQDDFELAIALHEESLAIALDHQDAQQQTIALWGLARASMWSGDIQRAVSAFEEGVALTRRLKDQGSLSGLLGNYGSMLGLRGDLSRAQTMLEEAAALYREVYGIENPIILEDLGYVLMHRGDLGQARELLTTSLVIQRERGSSRLIADVLETFAYLAVIERQPARAARLLGAAEALRQEIGAPRKPSHLHALEHFVNRGRAELSEEAWHNAWTAGQLMTLDDAIDYALSVDETSESCTGAPASPLSRREHEVLRLVVDGRTNQEIASELFISPRTVAQHLRSIYDKLGVDSRTAAATWAVRNGLA